MQLEQPSGGTEFRAACLKCVLLFLGRHHRPPPANDSISHPLPERSGPLGSLFTCFGSTDRVGSFEDRHS